MWCTSGSAPVAIDERQTGVSDGKTDVARRYVAVLGEQRERRRAPPSTARSNAAGVMPSTTMRMSFLPHFASVRSPAYRSGARRRSRSASAGSASASR